VIALKPLAAATPLIGLKNRPPVLG
jgi:hypothetical protein